MKYFLPFLFVCFLTSMALALSANAQPGMMPMRNFHAPVTHGPYKDSVEFKTEFDVLYPLIRSTPNVRERAAMMFARMAPMLKARGIDSAKAYDTAMKAIDPMMDKTMLFEAYRAEFSADELKPLAAFFKTPAGKHYLEVEPQLAAARNGDLDRYIARTMYTSILPMMKPMPPRPEGVMPPAPPPSKKETPDNLIPK